MRGLRAHGCGFPIGGRRLRGFRCRGQRRQIGALRGGDLCELRFDCGDFVGQARRALAVLAHGILKRIAARGQVGERGSELVAGFLRARQHGIRLGNSLVGARAALVIDFGLAVERLLLGGKPRQR